MNTLRIILGCVLAGSIVVGTVAAIFAAGESRCRDAHAKQMELQRVENERLLDQNVKLAADNERLRAESDQQYMQGFADGEAFDRQMTVPSLN